MQLYIARRGVGSLQGGNLKRYIGAELKISSGMFGKDVPCYLSRQPLQYITFWILESNNCLE